VAANRSIHDEGGSIGWSRIERDMTASSPRSEAYKREEIAAAKRARPRGGGEESRQGGPLPRRGFLAAIERNTAATTH
jgi:hypothetical protein